MESTTSESSAAEDTTANDSTTLLSLASEYPSDISLQESPVSPPDSIASIALDSPQSAWRSANPSNRLLMPSSCLGEDFVNIDHATKVLEVFRICKNEHRGTDLIIKINSFEIHCHRVVLSAVSSYFFDILTSSTHKVRTEYIELSGIDPEVLFALIDYAYTAELAIPKKKIQALNEAASILQFSSVVDACRKHLGRYRKRSTARSRHVSSESTRSRARTPDGRRVLERNRDLSVHKENSQVRMKKRSASASRLNNLSRPKQSTLATTTANDKPKRWSSNTKLYDSTRQATMEKNKQSALQRTSSSSRLNSSSKQDITTSSNGRNLQKDTNFSTNRKFEGSKRRRDSTSVAARSAKVRDKKTLNSITVPEDGVSQKPTMVDASSQTETKCKCEDTPRTISPGSYDSGFRSDSAISVGSLQGENSINPKPDKLPVHTESDSDDMVFENNNNKAQKDGKRKTCASSNQENGLLTVNGENGNGHHRLISDCNAITEEFSFSDPNHAKKLLRGLNRLRNEELFTDVMVRFNTTTFMCHRIMLESFSPFFAKLFEPEKYGAGILEVNIPKLKPEVFRKLASFLYTSKINLVARDCVNIFKVAKKFGMEDICDACRMFVFPDGRITKSRENLLSGSMELLVVR
ncbi:uncharacterized protein LOC117100501 isoform X2 [Anneissia japonica]|nr:uncharacterized protein LOC117100501 isoform X2 [Anneissia japonica]XP_033096118.1 uncharacterized protein LOC117100501 isoform X2 [Anneissia japonica]XP_033096119.1 uncharacterized protein LOC117100501 isoform X2 [Anneissia japonica]XP_033096120.1 uncharacterized protein LOC117100501 isoform X2 [Anneissia japonica]XP_033096121.1 uncharacterized protein LOC117100501 isoform X2 [Anneissia japonica]